MRTQVQIVFLDFTDLLLLPLCQELSYSARDYVSFLYTMSLAL